MRRRRGGRLAGIAGRAAAGTPGSSLHGATTFYLFHVLDGTVLSPRRNGTLSTRSNRRAARTQITTDSMRLRRAHAGHTTLAVAALALALATAAAVATVAATAAIAAAAVAIAAVAVAPCRRRHRPRRERTALRVQQQQEQPLPQATAPAATVAATAAT